MAAVQSVLLSAAEAAPVAAGTYYFLDEEAQLLYVGKAGSLRQRLRSHAVARPGDREARLQQLYRSVAEVRWETFADEPTAAAREADVVVALRPTFNASLSLEGRWNYLVVERSGSDDQFRFTLTTMRPAGQQRVYGCFPHLGKGVSSASGIACSDGYTAFLRLLWAVTAGPREHAPSRITRAAPDTFGVRLPVDVDVPLHRFLLGTSAKLLDSLHPITGKHAFDQLALTRDAETARAFFEYGPRRLRSLRLRHRRSATPLTQDDIRQLLVADVQHSIGYFVAPMPPSTDEILLGRRAHRWKQTRKT